MTRSSNLDRSAAAIIIGRNEGERLVRCLASVAPHFLRTIYVDSGSTDGSVAAAVCAGAEVVQLDMSLPFTAARARNAGLERLEDDWPRYVQFVDGDCELRPDWLDKAIAHLEQHSRAAIACGRTRERFPEASVYNRLCDREWDTPIGLTKGCGGIALARTEPIREVNGFDATIIAGEDTEICVRLRERGWEIWRLDAEMTLHDADIKRFSQWWRRTWRSGHAAAEAVALHGAPPERLGVAQVQRAALWGGALPVVSLVVTAFIGPSALLALIAYPVQIARLTHLNGRDRSALEYACFSTFGKFAELGGIIEYCCHRLRRVRSKIIEYK